MGEETENCRRERTSIQIIHGCEQGISNAKEGIHWKFSKREFECKGTKDLVKYLSPNQTMKHYEEEIQEMKNAFDLKSSLNLVGDQNKISKLLNMRMRNIDEGLNWDRNIFYKMLGSKRLK